MKKSSSVILVLFAALFTSCSDVLDIALPASSCGADINIGAVELTAQTQSYLPYKGTEKLVLKNVKTGEELTLSSKDPVSYPYTLPAGSLCFRSNWDRQNLVYNTVHLSAIFVNEGSRKLYFNYSAHVKAEGTSKETLNVLDYLSLGFAADTIKGANGVMTSQFRGTDSTKFTYRINSTLKQQASMELGGKTFSDVIFVLNTNTKHGVYIAKNKGLVAITERYKN